MCVCSSVPLYGWVLLWCAVIVVEIRWWLLALAGNDEGCDETALSLGPCSSLLGIVHGMLTYDE